MGWYAADRVLHTELGVVRNCSWLPIAAGEYQLRIEYVTDEHYDDRGEEIIVEVVAVDLYSRADGKLVKGDIAGEIYSAFIDKIPIWLEEGGGNI